ncbi:hypothetical protein DRQ53_11610 [bacterium]|nr:MAG: hypothetical protein DRQ53_11610 [bacterium]
MTTPLSDPGFWLAAASALAALIVALLVARRIRDHLADRRLRRAAAHSPILQDLLEQLESSPSLPVRRVLARRDFLADVARVDRWIEQTRDAETGAELLQPFPDSRLIDSYLVQIRKGTDENVRAAAAGLLGWTGSAEIVAPLLATARIATHRCDLLRSMALRSLSRVRLPQALDTLIGHLDRDDDDAARDVLDVLALIGPATVQALSDTLDDSSAPIAQRQWCARALGAITHPSAITPLLAQLSSADAELRAVASESLSAHQDPAIPEQLLKMLVSDSSPMVRDAVAKTLGQIRPGAALQQLAETLANQSEEMRTRAIEALEQLGPAAREILVVAQSDPEPLIAMRAARALQGIGAIDAALETLARDGYDAHSAEFLIEVGKAGQIAPLLDALRDPRESLPPLIVRILARIGDSRAGEALGEYLDSDPPHIVQGRVLDALRRVKDPGHALRASRLLSVRDTWLRKTAVDYLAEFGGPESRDLIAPLLDDPNPWTRTSALRILELLATHGIDESAARERLKDPYDLVRAQAVRTLCAAHAFDEILDDVAMEHLSEDRFREALLAALAEHATMIAMPLITRLLAHCTDGDLHLLRRAASLAISELADHEIDQLLLGYSDPAQESSARWFATVAWPKASHRAAAACREELLTDPEPRVRAGIVASLADRDGAHADLIVAVHRAMDDTAPVVVRAALETVGRCALHELESAVSDALHSKDLDTRIDATFVSSLLPSGPRQIDLLARTRGPSAQRVASTAARLLMNDPAAVMDWLSHLRKGSDRRIIERWIRSGHTLFAHMRALALEERNAVPSVILLCRSAFEAEQKLAAVLASHAHETERRLALRTLTSEGSDRCVGAIRNAFFRDSNASVRADALANLVERSPLERCRDYLEFGLEDRDESVRLRAIRLCSILPHAVTAGILAARLGRGERAQRAATIERLAALLQEEGEVLMDHILHPDRDAAALADLARVLDRCAISVCVPVLEKLLTHSSPLVRAASIPPLLHKLGDEGWRIVETGMADSVPKVRARTVQALSAEHATALLEDIDLMRSVLRRAHLDEDPEVRSRTALSLARLGIPGTTGLLGALEHDDDPRVERIARQARAELESAPEQNTLV